MRPLLSASSSFKPCPCCTATLSQDARHPALASCEVCGYKRRITSLPDSYYSAKRGRSAALEQEFARKHAERAAFLTRYLQPGQRVLELGCAEGALAKRLKQALELHYIGIELSEDAEAAREVVDEISRRPLGDAAFEAVDAVLSFHVLEHIDDLDAHLAAVRRALKAEGRFILEVPRDSGNRVLDYDPNPEHLHGFPAAAIGLLLQRNGFTVEFMGSGFYESGLYHDSLRIVARLEADLDQRERALRDRFARLPADGVVVVGLGGDYEGYVRPHRALFNCVGLADNAASRIGQTLDGWVVESVGDYAVRFGRTPAFIATYRFRDELRRQLESLGVPPGAIFDLNDVLGER